MIEVNKDGLIYETISGLKFCEKPNGDFGKLYVSTPIDFLGCKVYNVSYNIYRYNIKLCKFELYDYGGGMLDIRKIQAAIHKAKKFSDVGYLVEIKEYTGEEKPKTVFCEYSEGLKFLPYVDSTLIYLDSNRYHVLALDYELKNIILRDDNLNYGKASFDFFLNNQNLFKHVEGKND